MTPIGWLYALVVWGYSLAWFLFNDLVKLMVYRMMRQGPRLQRQHLTRISTTLHPTGVFAKQNVPPA